MNAYPLIRTKWTNEHLMAALLAVLAFYNLPLWVKDPSKIVTFIIVVAISLVMDAVINFVRFKKPVCAVSAAVTGSLLFILAGRATLIELIIGAFAALVLGKHLWGGTGKNILNPAVTGYLVMALLFKTPFPGLEPTWLLLPALLLSLPFLSSRPFAALGFMAGMTAQLAVLGKLSPGAMVSYGVLFFGCLVLTDPVTVTINPVAGGVAGFLAGLLALISGQSALAAALAILMVNLVSFAADRFVYSPCNPIKRLLQIKPVIPGDRVRHMNLTGQPDEAGALLVDAYSGDVLELIRISGVFGLGGAGFPAIRKIEAVMESNVPKKHLIINAAECDPGLVHDKWLVQNRINEISIGVMLLEKCVSFSSVTLAVKHPEDLIYPEPIAIRKIPDYYPAGAEKLLIKELLGISLKDNDIPAVKGILVLNVQTVYAVYEAVMKNKKADTRYITVADLTSNEAVVAKVGTGMKIRDIVDKIYPDAVNVFTGGGIMQATQAQDEDVVGQTVNFIAAARFPNYKESPQCSHCGRCVINCPMGLQVHRIAECADKGDMETVRKYDPKKCISCGSCSYVCLAGRNLAARIKSAKEYAAK